MIRNGDRVWTLPITVLATGALFHRNSAGRTLTRAHAVQHFKPFSFSVALSVAQAANLSLTLIMAAPCACVRRMAGTEWIWTHGTEPLERMCCLLAGVAVLTTKGDEDPIRKADAFGGRVGLPFFETRPPRPDALRIVLVPTARRWILFRLDKRGMPRVAASQRGFEGLCNVVLQLVASLR